MIPPNETMPGNSEQRVLVVEDEAKARLMLTVLLKKAGYQVSEAADGRTALDLLDRTVLQGTPFDIVVTDIRLGDIDGISVMHAARRQHPPAAVILLTGYGSLESAIAAIEAGASSYLLKPCKPPELLERVARAAHRRTRELRRDTALQQLTDFIDQFVEEAPTGDASVTVTSTDQEPAHPSDTATPTPPSERYLYVNDLCIDVYEHHVTLNGHPLYLTPTEYRLLYKLVAAQGRIVSYSEIARATHNLELDNTEAYKLVKGHIHNLRRKIPPHSLINIRGIGYRFVMRRG